MPTTRFTLEIRFPSSQAELVAKRAAQQRLVEANLPDEVVDSPPVVHGRNYMSSLNRFGIYGAVWSDGFASHSRIRTYDFHRMKVGRTRSLHILKGLIAGLVGKKPAFRAVFGINLLTSGRGLTGGSARMSH